MKLLFLLLLTSQSLLADSLKENAKLWDKAFSAVGKAGTVEAECTETQVPTENEFRYPQCIEGLTKAEVWRSQCPEQSKVKCEDPKVNTQACIEQGLACLKLNDKRLLPPNALTELALLDPDGTRECLFYRGTNIIKKPHPDHLEAIARNKEHINKIAKSFHIPATAIACSLGADATLTRRLWEDQSSLKNLMLQDKPARKALKYLIKNKIPVPEMKVWKSEESVIIKTAAILKEAELSYKENGFDISTQPEILATIYNIGASLPNGKYRAVGKPSTYRPKPNFFGVFCQRYQGVYEELLKE